jgi:hypothetical protein
MKIEDLKIGDYYILAGYNPYALAQFVDNGNYFDSSYYLFKVYNSPDTGLVSWQRGSIEFMLNNKTLLPASKLMVLLYAS